ncbi:LLM class flavin-dependent oxidoreductase [Kitasatospora sp. NPDC059646]|uniref:LLM class flavin-dependent oxidoreductase n=1 Tax=Kitasatospora sp. NPDC059646 TaxID=3346893 RepID=UPI0036CCCB2D
MDLELHGEVRAAPGLSEVASTARELEEDGFDGALVVPSGPEVWPAVGRALAATSRLRIAVAHRIGTTGPMATGGRLGAHLTIDSGDDEHLSLLTRHLDRDHAHPISLGGTSPHCLPLAARHARVYDVPALPLPDTRRRIAEAHATAARHGRTLRISRHVTVVLAETEDAARRRLRELLAETDAATRRRLATAHTGTPATVATRLHLLRSTGVQLLRLSFPAPQPRPLRRELITRLRNPQPLRRAW